MLGSKFYSAELEVSCAIDFTALETVTVWASEFPLFIHFKITAATMASLNLISNYAWARLSACLPRDAAGAWHNPGVSGPWTGSRWIHPCAWECDSFKQSWASLGTCSQAWRQRGGSKCNRFVNFWPVEYIPCYVWQTLLLQSLLLLFVYIVICIYTTNKKATYPCLGFYAELRQWSERSTIQHCEMSVYLQKLTKSLVMVLYILSYIRQFRLLLYCGSALGSWH